MTASHILVNASSYSAERADEMRSHSSDNTVTKERGRSSNESADGPEHDFRETFRQHLSTSSDAPQRARQVAESSLLNARHKEPASGTLGSATSNDLKQQASAPSKVAPAKPKQVANGLSLDPRPAANTARTAPAEQLRRANDGEQADSADGQIASMPVALGEQRIVQAGPETDDQAARNDEYVRPASGSDNTLDALPVLNPTSAANGDLALAMRVGNPGSAVSGTQNSSNPASAPGGLIASASLLRGSASVPLSETDQKHESSVPAEGGAAAVMDGGSASAPPEKAGRAAASEQTNPADFEAELAKFRNEPVRGAHVQIDGTGNQRVDIRLLERGGALSVSVRSGDATLTRALQDHSPELNARLATEHFQTELWKPDLSKQPSGRASQDGQGQWQGGSSGERSPDQRPQGQPNREPAWLEDLENHATAFQKRIEYTWHQ